MTMTGVETHIFRNSTNVEEATYNPETTVLQVTFKSGRTWEYEGVSVQLWTAFQHAASPGRFVQNNLPAGAEI